MWKPGFKEKHLEKVRFEAFNVEELRVLRRACYEAGAAFGDPGQPAADRPPVAPKAFQKPEPQKKRAVQRLDILERAKAAQPAESAHRAPELPVEAKFTGFLYVRCEKCGQERGFCAKTPISSCYCRECGGKTELKNMRQVKIWCECGSTYLAHGKPYGCATPWLVAWLGSLHGVVCTACGHYKPTVIAWNREWRKKNAQ